jgi:hypothetical protein
MAQAAPGGYNYQICLENHIGMDWVDWPDGVMVCHAFDQDGTRAVTLATVSLPDQPALYGLLDKFRDLNLKLVYLRRADLS